MIAALLSILGSSAVGSILGGIFAFLNKKSDLDAKRMDLEHERSKWAHDLSIKDKDLEYIKIEAQGRKDVAFVEGDYAAEVARMTAIGLSHQADQITAEEIKAAGTWAWMLVVGSALKAWIRPITTVVLTTAAIYINWLLIDKLAGNWPALTQAQQYDASMQALTWITGQAAATLSYWFISRGAGK
jgi:hypothetical protein